MENENTTVQTAAAANAEQNNAAGENKTTPSFEELLKNKDYQSELRLSKRRKNPPKPFI